MKTGMGGWSINPVAVEFIAKEYDIEDILLLLEYIEIIAYTCFEEQKDKKKENLPDIDEMADEDE